MKCTSLLLEDPSTLLKEFVMGCLSSFLWTNIEKNVWMNNSIELSLNVSMRPEEKVINF